MTDDEVKAGEAARRMRELPEDVRDAEIDKAANVRDLRPVLHERRKQREMAAGYRSAFAHKPPDGLA